MLTVKLLDVAGGVQAALEDTTQLITSLLLMLLNAST
jgi:hypothetical protein